MILAVDPGIRGCGVAAFTNGRLSHAAYVANLADVGADLMARAAAVADAVTRWGDECGAVHRVVLERPQIYASRIRAGAAKGDPNDLLGLAAVDGAIAALHSRDEIFSVTPAEWKGQLSKEACHARIRSRLDRDELVVMANVGGHLAHNVWDAVGIGLHHVGRFKRHRVIPH